MHPAGRYKGIDEILWRLEAVRSRRKALRIATGVLATMAVVTTVLLVTAVGGGYWPDQPPAPLRWALLATGCAAAGAALVWFALRAAFWRQSWTQTARFIEQALPELENDLTNSVLLANDRDQPSRQLVQQAIFEARDDLRPIDLRRSVSLSRLKRWTIALAAAAVMLAVFAAFQPGQFSRGLLAVFRPTAYVPAANGIELLSLTPGDATCFAGEPTTIVAKIVNDSARRHEASVEVDGLSARRPMLASASNSTYLCMLDHIDQTFRYRVRVGPARWPAEKPWYTLTVLDRIEVEGLDVEYQYPPYTHLPARKVADADGHLRGPVGSQATITLRLSAPAPMATLELAGDSDAAMRGSAGGRSFRTQIPISSDGSYRLSLKDRAGKVIQQLPQLPDGRPAGTGADGYYRIRAIPDSPPKVEFLAPAGDVSLPPGAKLAVKIRAADKFGLTAMRLVAETDRDGRKLADQSFGVTGRKEKVADYALQVPPDLPADGSVTIVYQASATDNRALPHAGGQTSRTGKFKIIVQDPAKAAAEEARKHDQLRRRLLAILNMQLTERVNTEICRQRQATLRQAAATGAQIAAGQSKIRAALAELVEKFDFPPEMAPVRQALVLLASNEAQLAIDQAKVLAHLSNLAGRDMASRLLAGTQDKIIDALGMLLAIAPALGEQAEATRTDGPAADLPPEVKDKLAKLAADLAELIDSQKKIIQASQRLAKRPVDTFTKEDQELLKELQTVQDKWEKFLNEAFTDLSKLARQDFCDPAMLKELISVKSDITMAKDALAKKAVEIATALENNGIENAESLTANIEKWLPDEPDRIKWSMEDPAEQMNVEQAELPTELEDLVGDLLEEEEDLFDEVDDVTSKYTMSGDKGIGWDANDGPISNMNAQGVTGNQLPNTSEMAGRSGEGRTGKSSGQFVEDKAVGKGGRRTPTRLTGGPFEAGQVNDVSDQPPSGATGGGKLSGAGAEGLEGPVPPELAAELNRLAGKQATLVNRAERLQRRFKASDYSNFRLLQAITLMNRVRNDLARRHYQNALRRRGRTLGAIRQTKLLLAGRIDVRADSALAMPKYVRDNIADAMKGKLPGGYREVLQQYYRRLSQHAAGR